MNAATGQFVHLHLISCLPYVEFGKEFLYTFPDLALYRGSSNGMGTSYGMDPRRLFRDLSLFCRFEMPTYDLYFRDVILMRRRVHDWQYDGRFMDDVGLAATGAYKGNAPRWTAHGFVPHPGVIAKWFLYERDGTQGILINFRNEERADGTRLILARDRVPFTPAGRAFLLLDDAGRRVTCDPPRPDTCTAVHYEVSDKALTLDVPPRRVGTLLVPGPAKPAEALRCFAWQSGRHGPDRLMLSAANLTERAIDAAWTARGAENFKLDQRSGQVQVPPFSVKTVEVPIAAFPQAMADVAVDWRYAGVAKSCTALLSPALRNGTMELDVNEDGSPDSWWNFDKSFCHIVHRYAYDVDMRSLPAARDTEVKRSGQASVRLAPTLTYALSVDGPFGEKGKTFEWRGTVSQHLYLKPDTSYRITARAFSRDIRARCGLSACGATKELQSMAPNEWTLLSIEFRTPRTLKEPIVTLSNRSIEKLLVWFDDVTIEETAGAAQ